MQTLSPPDPRNLVDADNGGVDRRIFADQAIYEMELERIFARAWNFMCHDSQIPNPGDFFMTFIGEDRVICVRDNEGKPRVLVNTCRHRGNAVCRAEEGHATSFMCTYHGWTYDLQGKLVGVPGFKEVYHEELDRENWGLITAGKVDSYKGFVFATMDPDAPELDEYLGRVGRLGLDLFTGLGKLKAVGGVQKWTIGCNWKFAVDNVWDFYHAPLTHSSAFMAGWSAAPRAGATRALDFGAPNLVVFGRLRPRDRRSGSARHRLAARANPLLANAWRHESPQRETLGAVGRRVGGSPHILPNFWLMGLTNQASLRIPRGPHLTEIWWFSFVSDSAPPDEAALSVRRAIHHDGPSGMFELDDGENWEQSTRGSTGRQPYAIHSITR